MVAERAIDRLRPDWLIVTGIAGRVREGLNLDDVVVSRDCAQHDLDATAPGFELGLRCHAGSEALFRAWDRARM